MTDPTPDLPADLAPLDARLDTLFAPVRPGPGLEDRVIAALKAVPAARTARPMTWPKALVATAAGLGLLAAVGAIFSGGRLAAPGGTLFSERSGRMPEPAESPVKLDVIAGVDDSGSTGSGGALDPLRGNVFRQSGGGAGKGAQMSRDMRAKSEAGAAGVRGFGSEAKPRLENEDTGVDSSILAASPDGRAVAPGANFYNGATPPANGPALNLAVPPPAGYFRPGEQQSEGGKDTNQRFSFSVGQLGGADRKPSDPDAGKAAQPPAPKSEDPLKGEPKANPKPDPKAYAPAPGTDPVPPNKVEPGPQTVRRVVIRSGDIEFEVGSFDAALATVTKLVTGINGAFVGTVNQDKLPNGKVRGSVVVRCPPEALDGLVLDLRRELGKDGELKGVKLASADVTKQYTDLESRLRAARTMETRLLQIIKEGKGEIKQLLEAERELGVWRTKIEEAEGELRYLSNLAALSTLTLTLAEREARAAAVVSETERVQAGVEVDDVDKAYQAVLAAVLDAKGRVLKSEVKQLAAGQYTAALQFEVPPEASGPIRDRLRQLGRVARLEIDRLTQAEGGAPLPKDAKPKRGDALFLLQLYNLANVAPRETAVVQVAVTDVPAAYQALRDALAKANGRVINAQLNEQDKQNVTAQLDFEVRRADEPAVRAALDATGEVVSRQVVRAPESDNVTDTKVSYRAAVLAAGRLRPRERTTLTVEVEDVDATAALFAAHAAEAKARPVDSNVSRDAAGRATAKLVYEVPLAAAAGLEERFKGAGRVRAFTTARDPQAPDGRFATARVEVTVTGADRIVGADDGVWPSVRTGLSYSLAALLKSLTLVVIGLCLVLPWALALYGGYRVVRWSTKPPAVPAPAATPPVPPS